jgi:NNP family nitrate/nitrite transporter-like MFS transporter
MQGENTSKTAFKKSALDQGSNRASAGAGSFSSQVRPVFFLAGLFFLNFASRIILSPLLPTIERELAISHSQAGFFFFLSSGGYLAGLLSSGVLTSRSSHRVAIVASLAGVGIAMLTIAAAMSLWLIRCGLIVLGFAAGFYLPSAIATITALVDKKHWGKAIAIHELAPNVAFFAAPFLAEIFLRWSTWRMGLGVLGALSLVASVSFSQFGRGGGFSGEAPGSQAFAVLVRTPAFWLMMVLFGVGVSSTIGVYAMLPLYLVSERNFDQSTANTVVAFSRSYGPFLGLLGGWASDKLGAKQTIAISLAFTGIVTLLLGMLSGRALGAAVLVQPLLAVWFFPAAFAAIAMITPPNARNLAVAFSVPVGYIIGGGAIPTFIGAMGDRGSFATGFVVTGLLIGSGGLLSFRLRSPAPVDAKK